MSNKIKKNKSTSGFDPICKVMKEQKIYFAIDEEGFLISTFSEKSLKAAKATAFRVYGKKARVEKADK